MNKYYAWTFDSKRRKNKLIYTYKRRYKRNSKNRKAFLVVRNEDNKAVGMIELFVNEYHRSAEIVYWIAKEFRRGIC